MRGKALPFAVPRSLVLHVYLYPVSKIENTMVSISYVISCGLSAWYYVVEPFALKIPSRLDSDLNLHVPFFFTGRD